MARLFNGTSDLIAISSGVNGPTAVTVSDWTFKSSDTGGYESMYDRTGGAGLLQFMMGLQKLAIYLNCSGGQVSYDQTGATISHNVWHHLAFTYSSATGLIGYIDGSVDQTAAANGTLLTSFTVPPDIGAQSGPGNFFKGRIADVCQWRVALTAGEIGALAKGARPPTVRPLSIDGYWPLDGLQSPEPDLSGFAHNGTLTGTTLAAGPPVMMLTPRWPQQHSMLLPVAGLGWIINRRNKLRGKS